jgi:catechol 2,3-dioxygenase-like lactoylglutathione lyase family enzyme
MLHHISVGVSNITESGSFYDSTLKPLGYFRVWEDLRPGEKHQAIGYGLEAGKDKFAIKERFSDHFSPGQGFHLAFAAPSKESVDEWHRLGLLHGGTDRGAPRIWDEFGPKYYAAYLIDPDGWQLEAVFKLA